MIIKGFFVFCGCGCWGVGCWGVVLGWDGINVIESKVFLVVVGCGCWSFCGQLLG